jgi:pimeloyl-ACP methyl ester carboxylesterase
MPKVRVGDIEMFYVEAGAGDPLVLVMGFSADHMAWALQMRAFAERYRVVAFDNRGAGQTDQPDFPYTIPMMAADTVGLMDALGVERAHVLGLSMGGMIAQEIALGWPERVRSLQLHATLARPDAYLSALTETWRAMKRNLPDEDAVRAFQLWIFAPETYAAHPELVETAFRNVMANPNRQSLTGFLRQGDAVRAHDTLDRLGKIRCPTLVSGAEDDVLVPPRFARQLAERIPGAELRIVPGAGHGYIWERFEEFNRMCLSFLGGGLRPPSDASRA